MFFLRSTETVYIPSKFNTIPHSFPYRFTHFVLSSFTLDTWFMSQNINNLFLLHHGNCKYTLIFKHITVLMISTITNTKNKFSLHSSQNSSHLISLHSPLRACYQSLLQSSFHFLGLQQTFLLKRNILHLQSKEFFFW